MTPKFDLNFQPHLQVSGAFCISKHINISEIYNKFGEYQWRAGPNALCPPVVAQFDTVRSILPQETSEDLELSRGVFNFARIW